MARRIGNFYQDDDDGLRWVQGEPATQGASDWESTLTLNEMGRWSDLANSYFFAVASAALLAAITCVARRNRLSLALILPALSWTLFFAFITLEPRFHFALGPVFAILAGALAVSVWDAVRDATSSRHQRMSASS